MVGRINHIKMAIHTKRGLEFNILKVTICEQQACNVVNVNVSIYLLIVECNLFPFPQNLKFLNTFLVFLTILIRFDLPRSCDPYIIHH